MDEAQIQRIMNHPEFQSMAKKKTSLGLIFTFDDACRFLYFRSFHHFCTTHHLDICQKSKR